MTYQAINTLLWLDIGVTNLDRAITFYQALLNTQARDARPHADSATLQLSASGSGITLIKQPEVALGSLTAYLNCNGRLKQALAQVKLNGGEVLQDIHSMEPFGVRAVILDSENNRIALHSAE